MTFVAGALVGIVLGLGLGAGLVLGRRRRPGASGGPGPMAGPKQWRAGVTTIAAIALVVAAIALVQSSHHHDRSASAPSSTAPQSAASTTASTPVSATVSVPNVVGSTRIRAVAALTTAGLKVSIDALALANVPDGFVISQNPLPAAVVKPGTTVVLVVSASP